MPAPDEPTRSAPPTVAMPPAARERAVDVLTRHYAADRIGDAELQARLDLVYQATTPAQLEAVLADLPTDAPGTDSETAGIDIRATLSGQEQKLTGALPRRLRLKARLGYVELDLQGATLQEGVTEIDVRVFAGYCEIRLPAGVRVESVGQALLGYIAVKGAGMEGDERSRRVVRITGRVICGYTEAFRKSAPELSAGEAVLKRLEGWWKT